jgi:hypothetical protein
MIDISNTQSSLRFLQEWLAANEFRKICSQQALVTSDDYIEWVSHTLRVEIRSERGEWYLGLGLLVMNNTFHPDEWEAWLDRRPLNRHLSDLDHQVDFITRRWMYAADLAVADVVTTEAALMAIGIDWVERRFGWRPNG